MSVLGVTLVVMPSRRGLYCNPSYLQRGRTTGEDGPETDDRRRTIDEGCNKSNVRIRKVGPPLDRSRMQPPLRDACAAGLRSAVSCNCRAVSRSLSVGIPAVRSCR